MVVRATPWLVVLLAGCEFTVPALGPDEGVTVDLGGGDLTTPAGPDLARTDLIGADFAGLDFATPPPAFAVAPDLASTHLPTRAGLLPPSCTSGADTVNLTT